MNKIPTNKTVNEIVNLITDYCEVNGFAQPVTINVSESFPTNMENEWKEEITVELSVKWELKI